MVVPEKDLYMRREFLEHNGYEFDSMIDNIQDPDPRQTFDKKSYHVPKYKEALDRVRELMKPKPKKEKEASTISSKPGAMGATSSDNRSPLLPMDPNKALESIAKSASITASLTSI